MDLSIVIPAYNEEKRIKDSICKIKEYINTHDFFKDVEIIVVNDGSKDDTKLILENISDIKLISYDNNCGKGYAVKKGVLSSSGDLVLITDSDLSTPITELDKFTNFVSNNDIIIGSRRMKQSHIVLKQPLHRQILGKSFGLITSIIALRGIKDSQCGFKLFKGSLARDLFKLQKINGFSFDVEILYLARKYFNAKILELPIEWKDSPDLSKVNGFKESFRMMKDLIYIRMVHKK